MSKENTNQAAANKAAEEGGLRLYNIGTNGLPFRDPEGVWVAYEDFAADRTSRQVANKAEVEPVAFMTTDKKMLVFADAMRKLQFDPAGMIALYEYPPATTGASTVLTDERTKPYWIAGFTGQEICPTTRGTALAAYEDGIKAREVAAQAGQVAVPETEGNLDLSGITSVVLQDRGSKSVIVRFGQSMAAATKFLDQFGTLVLNDRAAPSPAKESK